MRLPLAMLEVFVAIVRHGSLRAAADALQVKPSTVSHQLKALEARLGTALFVRTTRTIRLTEAGRALARGAVPAFEQVSDAVDSARNTGHKARGTLRLAMPDFVYHLIVAPALPAFVADYPDIALDLSVTDAMTDILDDGFHAGFRLGDRISQDMVAVPLTDPLTLAVVASPAYLAQTGRPTRPDDLLDHSCITYRFPTSGRIYPWTFETEGAPYTVDVRGRLSASTLPVLIDLASRGLGLAYTFKDFCARDLSDGRLVEVLSDHTTHVPGVHIYFPQEYRAMVPLRLLLDRLKGQGRERPAQTPPPD